MVTNGHTYSGHRVESDRLKADEVVARGDACGDRRRPARVLRDHLAGSPLAGVDGAGEETRLVDLEPLSLGRIDASAGRATRCEVGQLGACQRHVTENSVRGTYHRAGVVRPDLVPVRSDLRASRNRCGELQCAAGAVIVASNLRVRCIRDRVAENTLLSTYIHRVQHKGRSVLG